MISFKNRGNFERTLTFFDYVLRPNYYDILLRYGNKGVDALRTATPKDSGETANSWSFKIGKEKGRVILSFYNDEVTEQGTPIAILIQYGHATRNGGFVQGIDFINPALRPVFKEMANEIWGRVIDVK